MNTVKENDVVFSSCGKISREVYYVKDRSRNFYVMGSMGCCLSTAIGFAICKPKIKVISICGDGEILMSLGTLVLLNKIQDMYKGEL